MNKSFLVLFFKKEHPSLRWALFGAVTTAGFLVGALEQLPPIPDPMLNIAFNQGVMFDVQ